MNTTVFGGNLQYITYSLHTHHPERTSIQVINSDHDLVFDLMCETDNVDQLAEYNNLNIFKSKRFCLRMQVRI